jgi:hypothetical protein
VIEVIMTDADERHLIGPNSDLLELIPDAAAKRHAVAAFLPGVPNAFAGQACVPEQVTAAAADEIAAVGERLAAARVQIGVGIIIEIADIDRAAVQPPQGRLGIFSCRCRPDGDERECRENKARERSRHPPSPSPGNPHLVVVSLGRILCNSGRRLRGSLPAVAGNRLRGVDSSSDHVPKRRSNRSTREP